MCATHSDQQALIFKWSWCSAEDRANSDDAVVGSLFGQSTTLKLNMFWEKSKWQHIKSCTCGDQSYIALTSSGVTDGGAGCAPPPSQTKCKKWAPLLACILLIFTRFLFLAFFREILEYFPLISGASANESNSSHSQFAKIFVCV